METNIEKEEYNLIFNFLSYIEYYVSSKSEM